MKLPVPSFQLIGIVAAIAFAAGGTAAWRITSWQAQAREAAAVKLAAKVERAAQQNVITTLREQITAANAASLGYQNELTKLRGARDAAGPVPVVRLCKPAGAAVAGVPAASPAPGGSDGPAPAAGVVPQTPGPDIGPELYSAADDADELAARLRALQDWVKRLE